jgi:hypothetical protein
VKTRISLTKWLLVGLLIASCYAAWNWWRPYDWHPDAGARYRIVGVLVTRDHDSHWVEVHLKRAGAIGHDLTKPVRLVLASGRELEPANTRLGGGPDQGMTELWFKFWLDPGELAGPLRLRLNEAELRVKTTSREPALGLSGWRYYNSTHW